jgi:hypothetical protein
VEWFGRGKGIGWKPLVSSAMFCRFGEWPLAPLTDCALGFAHRCPVPSLCGACSCFHALSLSGRVLQVAGLPAGQYTLTLKRPTSAVVRVEIVQSTAVLVLGGDQGGDAGTATEILLGQDVSLVGGWMGGWLPVCAAQPRL